MWCGKPTNEFLANGIRINFSLVHEDIQMMGDKIYNEDKVICHLCIKTIGKKVPTPVIPSPDSENPAADEGEGAPPATWVRKGNLLDGEYSFINCTW